MISEIATGVLTQIIVATGRRIGGALAGADDGQYRDDLEVAIWFNTYRLTGNVPDFISPSSVSDEAVSQLLEGDTCQAVLHELLAARLCDAPELDIARLRDAFTLEATVLGTQPDVKDFTEELFNYFDETICTMVGRLEGGLPDMLPKLREGAIAARIVAALHAIERHTAALSGLRDPAVEHDFLIRYRRHVVEHHGKLQPPDFERRRRVPIDDLYVSPDMVRQTPGSSGIQHTGMHTHMSLEAFAREIDRTVLLGSPGVGKTTAAHVLMHHHAGDHQRGLPFLVTLRQFASQDRSIVGQIEHTLETFYQCVAPPGLVARQLLNGSALVIFDGLDELVDTSRRAEVTAVIERFATEYPLARILVTSRIVGYDQARLDPRQFTCYRIGDFDEERVREYVRKWFVQEERLTAEETDRWTTAFIRESAGVPDLRANPLMLALMCILYRGERSLPRDRIGIYEQSATLLFRRWDAQRDIRVDLRVHHLIEPILRHLAFWLFIRDIAETAVEKPRLIAETTAFLQSRGFETYDALEAAREFVEFCTGRAWVFADVGTTAAGEPLFTFTHRTFLEYFAAYYLAIAHDTPERLAHVLTPRIARQEWDVVAELAIQIKDRTSDRGAERVITEILGERRTRAATGRGNILRFLARSVNSIILPPSVVRDLVRRVLDHAFLTDRRERKITAVPLGTLLANCWPCRDIVSEEVKASATRMLDSTDPEVGLDGLRLAVWCGSGQLAEIHGAGGRLSQDAELERFWSEVVDQNVEIYRDRILAASMSDPGLCYLALRRQLLTVKQVLARSDQPLAAVFGANATGLFAINWAPWMLSVIAVVMGVEGWITPSPANADCDALGQYLTDSWPQPPWDLGSVGWNVDLIEQANPTADLAGPGYVGAIIGLLVFAEQIFAKAPDLELDANPLGPLESLRPYLKLRLGRNLDTALPDLPVPAHVQDAVTAWAMRRINFDALTPSTSNG